MNAIAFAHPPPTLRELAVRELASPGYRLSAPASGAVPWWQRLLDRVGEFWTYVVRGIFGHAHAGNAPAVTGGALVLIAMGAVAYGAWRLFGTISLERSRSGSSVPLAETVPASEWYRRAVASASRGDMVDASRHLLAATVTALATQGAISPTAGSTVGDLRRSLEARAPHYGAPFGTVARAFATGVYAQRPLDGAEIERAMDAYRAIADGT